MINYLYLGNVVDSEGYTWLVHWDGWSREPLRVNSPYFKLMCRYTLEEAKELKDRGSLFWKTVLAYKERMVDMVWEEDS